MRQRKMEEDFLVSQRTGHGTRLASGKTAPCARKDAPRRIAMVGADMGRNEPDRGGEHRCIIGEADDRQHVGDQVEWQDEIGERGDQNELDATGRVAIEGTEIGREQVFGKGQIGRKAPEFRAKLTSNASPSAAAAAAPTKISAPSSANPTIFASGPPWRRLRDGTRRRQPQDAQRAAMRSIASASAISSSVMPPASWVASVTCTVL
jgi:hypothetical protein